MRSVVPGFLVWIIASGAAAQTAPPPARDTRPPATGAASISGRVVDAETGSPVRRATIRIVSPAIREPRSISTDTDGRYAFPALPAGRYNVSASKVGFIGWSYGQLRAFEPGKPIAVVDRQQVTGIDFRIPRGGVITGQVVDEFGDPVPGVMVSPLRYQFTPTGRQASMNSGPSSTNDIGEFRLYGLVPGDYLISAAPQRFSPMQEVTLDTTGNGPTFYPSSSDESQAQTIRIETGQVVTGVVIALTTATLFKISGTVVDAEGRPVTTGGVNALLRQRTSGMNTIGTQIRPDGTFVLNRVPAGSYLLRTMIGAPGPNSTIATAYVDVNGGDTTNVRLMPEPPVMVRGQLIFDPPDPSGTARAQAIRINLIPTDPTDMAGFANGPIDPASADGTFALKGRPGKFRVAAAGIPPTSMIQRIVVDGRELPDQTIEIGARDMDDVQVVITNRVGQVSGRVLNSRGEAADSYTTILFPQDRARWTDSGRPIGRPDEQGQYVLRPLRAGEYYIVAVDRVEAGQWFDPDFLESLRSSATAVTLREGETKTLDLKLIEAR